MGKRHYTRRGVPIVPVAGDIYVALVGRGRRRVKIRRITIDGTHDVATPRVTVIEVNPRKDRQRGLPAKDPFTIYLTRTDHGWELPSSYTREGEGRKRSATLESLLNPPSPKPERKNKRIKTTATTTKENDMGMKATKTTRTRKTATKKTTSKKTRATRVAKKKTTTKKSSAIVETKFCGRCERTRKEEFFPRNRSQKDGLSCWCKECWSEYNRLKREGKNTKKTSRKSARRKSARRKSARK